VGGAQRARDHRFFTGMALTVALIAFVGFAPTYYLRSLYGAPPLPTLVHVHGLLSSTWVLLFVVQTSLVAAHRTDLHRRLGIAGVLMVLLLLLVGWFTAIDAARRGVTPPGGPPPLAFLSVPIGTLAAFAVLAGAGLVNRRRSETHKRLMLLASISLLTPAIARFRYFMPGGPALAIGGTCALVVVCLVYDRVWNGRVHPAFLWGGLFLMASLPARFALGATGVWQRLAVWLTH
jgi:FtsH-binding integral membrane protein